MQEVLEKIHKGFDFLFEKGFEIAESFWSEGFGNWVVYLYSNRFFAILVQDRGKISLRLVSPPTHDRKLSDLEFFDAQTVIGYFTRNVHYTFFQENQQNIDIQFTRISCELKIHFEQICSFFERSHYRFIKEDFESFREEVRAFYLGPYGYKSCKK